jgi:hypothetical protein
MKKSGQVWIETVLYTLIGLTLIGLALGFIMPQINAAKDRATVEQAINSLGAFDAKINEVIETGTGNIRQIEFYMSKGDLEIVSSSYAQTNISEIRMTLGDLSKPYSEPGVEINVGRIKVNSSTGQKTSSVLLRALYPLVNITYDKSDVDRKFASAPTPYKFSIENKGSNWIDIKEISG